MTGTETEDGTTTDHSIENDTDQTVKVAKSKHVFTHRHLWSFLHRNKRPKRDDHIDSSKDPLKFEQKKETFEDYIDTLTKKFETEQNKIKGGAKDVNSTTENVRVNISKTYISKLSRPLNYEMVILYIANSL